MTERERDELLVERVQGGDRQAFDLLVSKYRRRLIRMLSQLVHDSVEAEDIAQETFIRAFRTIRRLGHEAVFCTWLYRLGIIAGEEFLLTQTRHIPTPTKMDLDRSKILGSSGSVCDLNTPESLFATKQILCRVSAVMEGLPLSIGTAVYLHEIEGLSYAQISDFLDCPIVTARTKVFRAREVMAEELRAMLDFQTGDGWPNHKNARRPSARSRVV